jgi:hypothetical protein
LHHGIQVDDGTLALFFQDGEFKGVLQPGYHTMDNFFERLVGLDKGKAAHVVLLDMQSAEIDFMIENVRVKNQIPIDVRLRLLFRVKEPKLFTDTVLRNASSFTTADLAEAFQGDVAAAVQAKLADHDADQLMVEPRARELLEADIVADLAPTLGARGLEIQGVRLADFGGQAIEYIREKLGELGKLNREYELNRQLRDALRSDKSDAFRDEEQLKDYYEQVTHEFGFKSAEREQERRRFLQDADHRYQLEGLKQDYESRRSEILNRLDEQKLRHQDEITEVRHQVAVDSVRYEEMERRQQRQFAQGQQQQVSQSRTDLEVARSGVEALKMVKDVKLEARRKEEELNTDLERERLKIRADAPLQALLASVTGEQADRLLKYAELEMRKGLSAEQALALVAEKSPEIAPSIAEALKAKYSRGEESK